MFVFLFENFRSDNIKSEDDVGVNLYNTTWIHELQKKTIIYNCFNLPW